MAGFRKDRTTAAQTSANVSGAVTGALIAAGIITTTEAAKEAVVDIFEALFDRLGPVVDADNELFAAVEAEAAAADASKPKSTKAAARQQAKAQTGDGEDSEDLGDIVLKSGKFKGCTLREVYMMSPEEASAYGHRPGEPGLTYIKWLATAGNPNKWTRARAEAFLAEMGL